MKFSRNPVTGQMEIYTDEGVYVGIMSTFGDSFLQEGADQSAEDGGPGSGNWGHKGRPGKRGGSGPGGGSQYRGGRSDIGYYGSRGDWLNGLSGDKQHQAAKFIGSKRLELKDKLDRKQKIEGLWKQGYLTRDEADEALKKAGIKDIREDMSPEEYVMKNGSEMDKSDLIGHVKEARNWDQNAEKMIKANLSEDERKIYDYVKNNFPDKDNKDHFQVLWDLEAKAMDLPTSGADVPLEIEYAAGTKERPAPPTPEASNFDWFSDASYGRGGEKEAAARCMALALGEKPIESLYLDKERFIKQNQHFVDEMAYGKLNAHDLSRYGIRVVNEMRDAMTKTQMGSFGREFGKFQYTPEMVSRLTEEEKADLLRTVNAIYNERRFTYRTFDKVEDIPEDVYNSVEIGMRTQTPRTNARKEMYQKYILAQEKMLLGVTPRSPETIQAEKAAAATEKARVRQEKIKEWKGSHTEEQIRKMYTPDAVSGVSRGNPMGSHDADDTNANPDRALHKGRERGNCQTCTMAYEMRRRGYNVVAKPRNGDAESYQERLSKHDEGGWLDPETGEDVETIVSEKKLNRNTAAKWVDDTIKDGERYELSVCWNYCSGAHILIAEKENGVLSLVDPQSGKRETGAGIVEYFGNVALNSTSNGNWKPYLRRIDNALPKQEYYDNIFLPGK